MWLIVNIAIWHLIFPVSKTKFHTEAIPNVLVMLVSRKFKYYKYWDSLNKA